MGAQTGVFGAGGVAKANGADVQIFHIKAPMFPQFRFEWHPGKKSVYLIRVGAQPEIGENIAENADDQGRAQMAVLIWLRGYRAAKAELGVITELPRRTG